MLEEGFGASELEVGELEIDELEGHFGLRSN